MFSVSYPAIRAQFARLRLHQIDQDRFWHDPVLPRPIIDRLAEEAGPGHTIHVQRLFINLQGINLNNSTSFESPHINEWYATHQMELFLERLLAPKIAPTVLTDRCIITIPPMVHNYDDEARLCFIMSPWSLLRQSIATTITPKDVFNRLLTSHEMNTFMDSHGSNKVWQEVESFKLWSDQIDRFIWPSVDDQLAIASMSNIKYNWRQGQVEAANAIVLTYFHVMHRDATASSLLELIRNGMPQGIQFTPPDHTKYNTRQIVEIRSPTHPLDPPIGLVIAFAMLTGVFFCASYSLGSVELVKSKNGIGFAAVLSIVFSLSMSYGLSASLGITYEIMPRCELYMFMVLISCIENMFIVTNSVVSTSMDLPVSERVGRGFRAVGIPMSIGALGQIAILWSGFFLGTDALKEFCLLMVFTVCYSHILQLLFLVPILCIDIRRLELTDLHDRRVVRQIHRFPSHGESRVTVLGISVRRYHTVSTIGIIFCLLPLIRFIHHTTRLIIKIVKIH
ncbi:sterol-sensing domain of SREBP cleavage-activation-domain-containing protein [Syncephalis fuscata]|nr:sterol-sensing domain of SREBP cleavage-activation-domain-containing protein [Syncephalis fuscata]